MYQYDATDNQTLIDNPPFVIGDWDKSVYDRLRNNIRSDYYTNQLGCCFYCKTELEANAYSAHLDHIINKALKPQWMFLPMNLVLTCYACNVQKGQKRTVRSFVRLDNMVIMPTHSTHYKIVHPYFDIYDHHLELEDGLFIKAKNNDKGAATIEMCKLWRPIYAARRAKEQGISDADKQTKILFHISKPEISPQERQEFEGYIDSLIAIGIARAKKNVQ